MQLVARRPSSVAVGLGTHPRSFTAARFPPRHQQRLRSEVVRCSASDGKEPASSQSDSSDGESVMAALRAAKKQQAKAAGGASGSETRRQADSTDPISSALTRRFGIAGGLAWLGVLTFGVVSEQVKTRLELAAEESNTKDVVSAKEMVTASGLKYKDIKRGGGARPQRGDLVAIDLTLSVDGEVLLDTQKRGRSIAFIYGSRPLSGGLTLGVEEAVTTMQSGGRRTVLVPPALAYGDEGAVLTPNPKKPDEVVRVPGGVPLMYDITLLRVSIAPA